MLERQASMLLPACIVGFSYIAHTRAVLGVSCLIRKVRNMMCNARYPCFLVLINQEKRPCGFPVESLSCKR